MRRRREEMPPSERAQRSSALSMRLLSVPEVAQARALAGFKPFGAEVDPGEALQQLERTGALVVFPRVSPLVPRLRFHSAAGEEDFVTGVFGIREPAPHCPELDLRALQVVVAPALAFDPWGGRLGYGGGYYDEVARCLHVLGDGRALVVAVGFDFQLVDRCPIEPFDVPVDMVVTEEQIIRCPGGKAALGSVDGEL